MGHVDARFAAQLPSAGYGGEAMLACPASQVRRVAFPADGAFHWMHTAPGAATGETAVLLCPGVFWDFTQPYHALRLLADSLADAGYPTLRLTYPGTGDAADLPLGGDIWEAWLASVETGAARLQALTGAKRVVLCGLRLGGMLAALAAARCPNIAGLILIAPVLRGKSYLRQLQMEAKLECGEDGQDGGLVFHEACFDADVVSRLMALDLAGLTLPPGLKLAMFLQAPSTPAARTEAAWRAQGLTVSMPDYAGLEPLLRQTMMEGGDSVDFAGVVAWLRLALPPAPTQASSFGLPPALLTGDGFLERPFAFGQGLFGVFCQPIGTTKGGHAVLIVNTGRDPHFGIARFGVGLARHLARQGIASLRMDFAGLGDSNGVADAETMLSSLFADQRDADIRAGLDLLQAAGCRAFAIQGLCSGAYHAFHAAVKDARVGQLLLINMPLFAWVPADTVQFAGRKLTPARHYISKLVLPHTWRRLLAGQIDIAGVARAQLARLRERLGGGTSNKARAGFGRLNARSVRSLMLYSAGDPGIEALEHALGGPTGTAPYPGVEVTILARTNHTLSGAAMRVDATKRMTDFLCGGA